VPPARALLAKVESEEVATRRLDDKRNLAHWDENMASARGRIQDGIPGRSFVVPAPRRMVD
jgi:hypothetical protein